MARRGTNALFDPTTVSTTCARNKEYRLVFIGTASINAKRYSWIIICASIMKDNKTPCGISYVSLSWRKRISLSPAFFFNPSFLLYCSCLSVM